MIILLVNMPFVYHNKEFQCSLFEIGSQNLRRLHTNVDKTVWDIAPTAVNAYYNPLLHSLKASWPPIFEG